MRSTPDEKKPVKKISPLQWAGVVLVYLFIPLLLLACAGDLRWWQAWVYGLLIVAVGIVSRVLAEKRHPGLMAERVKFGAAPDVKPWDRVLSPLMSVSVSFPLVIVAGLDHRYGWTSPNSILRNGEGGAGLSILGFVLIALGYAFATWAVAENRFFSSVVRIQTERGHTVCDSGPYRIVRHPGYAGNTLSLAGIVLALGSLWTIIPAVLALAIAVVRTALEDRTLQEELPGYREYAQRVRWRLLPGVW